MIFVPKNKRCFELCCVTLLAVGLLPACLSGAAFDVKAFGAKGDGKAADRDSINNAIEAASAAGGGTVYFPAGTYLTALLSG